MNTPSYEGQLNEKTRFNRCTKIARTEFTWFSLMKGDENMQTHWETKRLFT
jgi:hypothetical protein